MNAIYEHLTDWKQERCIPADYCFLFWTLAGLIYPMQYNFSVYEAAGEFTPNILHYLPSHCKINLKYKFPTDKVSL